MELRSLPAEEIVAFMGKAAFHWDFDGWMIFASVEMQWNCHPSKGLNANSEVGCRTTKEICVAEMQRREVEVGKALCQGQWAGLSKASFRSPSREVTQDF